MTTISSDTAWGAFPATAQTRWQERVFRRFDRVLATSPEIPFDDSSRIVFFSDCHRGDNGRSDAFKRNASLFLQVLQHYDNNGFSYVEVGDGDELWQNRSLRVIRAAHARVFEMLHRLQQQNRLHLIFGNHDVSGAHPEQMEKDGMLAREGLVLRHRHTRQSIFVVHGHQADLTSYGAYGMSRFLVRYIWSTMQRVGLARVNTDINRAEGQGRLEKGVGLWLDSEQVRVEQRIREWTVARRQVVICGHTHMPAFSSHYFNTGTCIYPGYITGLEIQGGEISAVKWTWNNTPSPRIERQLMAAPRRLTSAA